MLSAMQANTYAQVNLGDCYRNGIGVLRNYEQALSYYILAAERRNPHAEMNLHRCYTDGIGVAPDHIKAEYYLALATEQDQAYTQFKQGLCYYNGQGVEQDYKKAVQLFTVVAKQGSAAAQNSLGICYYNGHGVAQDYWRAVELFRLAAEPENTTIQFSQGMYHYLRSEALAEHQAAEIFISLKSTPIAQSKSELAANLSNRPWQVAGVDDCDEVPEKYTLLEAKPADYDQVKEFYQHHPVPGYAIQKVEIIHNSNMNKKFALNMSVLQGRHVDPEFTAKWQYENNSAWRKVVYAEWQQMASPYKDSDCPNVKLLPNWHAADPKMLESIFKTGYASLSTMDGEFFARGLYGMHEAAHAYKLYSKGALTLNWMASYSAYPVIYGDLEKLTTTDKYKNYDSHFVPLCAEEAKGTLEVNYLPTKPQQTADCHAMLVVNNEQCLPRYLVHLQATLLKSPNQVLKDTASHYSAVKTSEKRKAANFTPMFNAKTQISTEAAIVATSKATQLAGHSGSILCLQTLPDNQLASGSADNSIKIWDVLTGECQATLSGHSAAVRCLQILPDGRLASGSFDKTIRVWNIATMACEAILTGHTDKVRCLQVLSGNLLASGSFDKKIKIWNLAGSSCQATLTGHSNYINCLQALPDNLLASGSRDNTIKIWHLASNKCQTTLSEHSLPVLCLQLLPDNKLVSSSQDKSIKIWDLATKNLKKSQMSLASGHTSSVNALQYLPNNLLASGSGDHMVKIWDLTTGTCQANLIAHSSYVNCLAALPDNRLASGSDDQIIKLWDSDELQQAELSTLNQSSDNCLVM